MRWIAFSSKRGTGLYRRTYLVFVDPSGEVHKPFVVPRHDPGLYDDWLWTMSVPELYVEPVPLGPREIASTVTLLQEMKVESPVTLGNRDTAGGSGESSDPRRQAR